MWQIFLTGLGTAAGLIIAIGAQNVKRKIKMQRKRKLIVQSDPIVTLVNLSLRATATAAAVAVASR